MMGRPSPSPTGQRLRALDEALRYHKQVLVELTPKTRWERPELVVRGDTPVSGYALASKSTHRVRRNTKAYVSDINHGDVWRELDAVYVDLAAVLTAVKL